MDSEEIDKIKENYLRSIKQTLYDFYINRGLDLEAAEELVKERESLTRFDNCPKENKAVMPLYCVNWEYGQPFQCEYDKRYSSEDDDNEDEFEIKISWSLLIS